MYMDEEEIRYLLPLKEYVAYCDSLRYAICMHYSYTSNSTTIAISESCR